MRGRRGVEVLCALGMSLALTGSACTGGGNRAPRALITIDGSSTVYPIAEAISEEFQLQNPRVMVTAARSGTGGGFNRFCRGETDISAASRPMQEAEARRCAAEGVDYVGVPVALDGLSVIVSRENQFVDCFTVEELRNIWRPGSRVRTWRDIRPDLPGVPVHLFGPGTESGSYDYFTEAIVGEVGASRTDFQASEDDNVLVQGITGDPHALGFFGYAYLVGNRDRLRVVAVDGGNGCVEPTEATIRDGSYLPLSRPLFIFVKRSSLKIPGMRDFLRFFMANAAATIPETGFVPLPDSVYLANLRELDEAAGTVSSPDSGGEGAQG